MVLNASEIHCINSSFAHLVDRSITNGKKFYHNIRGGKLKFKRNGNILSTKIKVEVSCEELIDKLTILSIKKEKIKYENKLKNVVHEYNKLQKADILRKINESKFDAFYLELKKINSELWEIEDEIRIHEKNNVFNDRFIKLARSVYITNDQRFDTKNKINSFFSSGVIEEKIMKNTKLFLLNNKIRKIIKNLIHNQKIFQNFFYLILWMINLIYRFIFRKC